MWNPNLAFFSQSEEAIPSEMDMFEFYCVMKLHKFLFSSEFHIENESKVDEINIEVRNQIELNLVGYESKVNRIEKFGIRPSLSLNPHRSGLGVASLRHQHPHKTV